MFCCIVGGWDAIASLYHIELWDLVCASLNLKHTLKTQSFFFVLNQQKMD